MLLRIFLFALLLPGITGGQTIQDIMVAYDDHCNELVMDTIEQTGVITYDLIPIKNKDGGIDHFVYSNPDTSWHKPECPEYKHQEWYAVSSSGSFNLADGTHYFLMNDGYIDSIVIDNRPSKVFDATKHKVKIKREYYCQVKRREIVYGSDYFWEYARKYKK